MQQTAPAPERPKVIVPADVLKMLLDVDELVNKIEAYLRGYVLEKNPDGTFSEKKIGEPLLNENGIQELLKIIRSRLDPALYGTSNLDMSYIREEVRFFNDNLIQIIQMNEKNWELNVSHFQEIIDYIVSAFEATLRKGLNAEFMRSIFGTRAIIEEQKRKLFGMLSI
ncbi:MAG: hypothetical protein QXT63_07600 [Thermoplasmata archaeon]